MRALLIRSKSPLKELADQIYGRIFNAKYEERESVNKGGLYYRAYGLFCDFSLIEYNEHEFLIITDSKALFKDETELNELIYSKIKLKLNGRDIESEVVEI
ncbi:MAG: hypothetical protein GY873_38860 [Bosea sp.]|uniref:hypothetical protein n=1 Tax=Bosea sp. (in: a-proteobacteria) TaxID=1871050 RepID=UPI00238B4CB4|nr:hypothetical protein [Bosea sp. (in: a-proteobacteria)]MCP4740166.1 hypothetical protein [Bosea sp. (in: a-proteobacteria)]